MSKMNITKTAAAVLLAGLLTAGCSSPVYLPADETDAVPAVPFTYTESDDSIPPGNAQSNDDMLYHGGYIYIMPGDKQPVYRYNVKTGNVTCMCQDPLCMHDTEECPLYGLRLQFYITADGELCFYRQFGSMNLSATGMLIDVEHFNDFVLYDTEKQKIRVLESYGNTAGFMPELYIGDYRYYNGQVYDAETDESEWGLMRMELSTGEREWFGAGTDDDGNAVPVEDSYPCFVLGERLYFQDALGIFSLNMDGEDRREHAPLGRTEADGIRTDGEYLYYRNDGCLLRTPIDGGEAELLTDGGVTDFCLTENWLTYETGGEVVLGKAEIYGYAGNEVVLSGGEIHRCRHDGSEDTAVFTFEGELAGTRPVGMIVEGNYMYCGYVQWTDADGDGIYRDGDSVSSMAINGKETCTMLRIDLTTGETMVIEVIS
ncbi:MAG: hypothetical protein IJ497_08910 [Clostridia bacterium]|nr:hypothetical protein [Clostridia bacterium]